MDDDNKWTTKADHTLHPGELLFSRPQNSDCASKRLDFVIGRKRNKTSEGIVTTGRRGAGPHMHQILVQLPSLAAACPCDPLCPLGHCWADPGGTSIFNIAAIGPFRWTLSSLSATPFGDSRPYLKTSCLVPRGRVRARALLERTLNSGMEMYVLCTHTRHAPCTMVASCQGRKERKVALERERENGPTSR